MHRIISWKLAKKYRCLKSICRGVHVSRRTFSHAEDNDFASSCGHGTQAIISKCGITVRHGIGALQNLKARRYLYLRRTWSFEHSNSKRLSLETKDTQKNENQDSVLLSVFIYSNVIIHHENMPI